MGGGKSTLAINHINNKYGYSQSSIHQPSLDRCIVVAPSLLEVQRYKDSCKGAGFVDPFPVDGRKMKCFKDYLAAGKNICTTHHLFKNIDGEVLQLIRQYHYELIIDEALECVELYDKLSPSDLKMLLNQGCVHVDKDSERLRWNPDALPEYKGKFDEVHRLCINGNLVWHKEKFLLWEFPFEAFQAFRGTTILTYLFEGSPMAAYLRMHSFDYEVLSIKNGTLVPHNSMLEDNVKQRLRPKIALYAGPNKPNIRKVASKSLLSSTGYERLLKSDEADLKAIKSSMEHFFKTISRTPSRYNGFTTFKKGKKALSGAGYTKGFIPCNAKGTNEYKDKIALAYMCDIFLNPIIKNYFISRGVSVCEDNYALSEMIQWVWRSQIRDGKPIHVYILSDRMRELFMRWLG